MQPIFVSRARRFFLSSIGFLLPALAFSQISEEEILTLLERQELATARARINEACRQHPNSAVAAYFRAVLEDNGESAQKYFQEVTTRFRGTVYAERALFRLGQYHFAEGTYGRARQYFTNLLEQYPHSQLAPQARYYAAKALMIIGNAPPQTREELARCAEKYPGTWMAKFAAEDLARLESPAIGGKTKVPEPAPPKTIGAYTVELSAFDKREKAVSQQAVFSKAGYPTQLKEERRGRKVYYKVWVGDFADRNHAQKFSEEIQRKFKVKCHVLKRG